MANKKFYAVRKGRTPGIYQTWSECQAEVTGVKGAEFKSFLTLQEAELFLKKEPDNLYDDEAIAVYDRHGVKCGMIANSVSTVARGTMSAGRVFDRTEDGQKAVVRFILEACMIAQFQTIVQL